MLRLGQISSRFVWKIAERLSTKDAWARYCKRRWPNNTVKAVISEWGLTEGAAKGLVFGQASQSTIDQVLDHPRGGFALGLEILAVKTAITLEQYIEQQAHNARRERAELDAREQRLRRMEADLQDCRSGSRGLDRGPPV